MGSIRRAIAGLFSTDEGKDLLAALMDALAVTIATLGLWTAFTTFVDPTYIADPFAYATLVSLFQYSIITLGVSYIAIAAIEDCSLRRTPSAKRSVTLTAAAILLAIALPVGGLMTLRGTFDLHTGLELFTTLGLIAVPAAIRLSGPAAFASRRHCTGAKLADRLSSPTQV